MTTNYVDVWNNCLHLIQRHISPQSFEAWFKPVRAIGLEGNVLTLEVPSQFFYEYLETHYVETLRTSLREVLGHDARLEYSIIVDNSLREEGSIRMPSSNAKLMPNVNAPAGKNRSVPNPFVIPGLKNPEIESHLNNNYSFDNFIEGDCNRLARSAGFAVASKPGSTAFNPLFVYGGTGLGKTHLLHAIGNKTKEEFPFKAILYLSSEQFSNQYVESVRKGGIGDFMNFFRMIDVLLVDDIHFLSGRLKTQESFFHIFNQLRQAGKQLVMASDRAPHEMEGMEERLLSRFKWGLSANLQVPNLETRRHILKVKMWQNGIELPEEVIEYISENINSNVRELEGAMVSLIAQSALARRDVDLDLAQSLLQNFVDKVSREITIESISRIVADHCDVEVEDLKSKTRKRMIVQARQLAMYFAKQMTQHSLKSIGLHFGGRDHTTVIHALQTVNDLIVTDKQFRHSVEEISKRINQETNK